MKSDLATINGAPATAPDSAVRWDPLLPRLNWTTALATLGLFFAMRCVYLIWLSPWELVGDEAYYWLESQHPALSYSEKGPLLPWILWFCVRLLGNAEWVVRLPMLLGATIACWGIGRITLSITRGDTRAAFFAIALFLLTPAFIANGQICTQDGVEVTFIVALTAIGLRLVRREESLQQTWGEWLLFYTVLGLGILLKQSLPLFLTSFVAYAAMRRRHLRWRWTLLAQQLCGGLVVIVLMLPILIGDSRSGWPLLQHTLGHLGAGGDQTGQIAKGNQLIWIGNTLGGLIAAIGPVLVMMVWASQKSWRERFKDDGQWRDQLWLMCAAWPSVSFFVALSFIKPVIPSWPLPLVVPLIPLAAKLASDKLSRQRFQPTGFGKLWNATVVYGCGALLLLSFPNVLGLTPFVGETIDRNVVRRFIGARDLATRVRSATAEHPSVALIVAQHYQKASLLAYYLRGTTTVTCAGGYFGMRVSSFDRWPDTALDQPHQLGRDMILVGNDAQRWGEALAFDRIEPAGDGLFLGTGFRGVRAERTDRR